MSRKKFQWTDKTIAETKTYFQQNTSKCLFQILSDLRRGLPLMESVQVVVGFCKESERFYDRVFRWSYALLKDSKDYHAKNFSRKLFGFSSLYCFNQNPSVVLDVFQESIDLRLYPSNILIDVVKKLLVDVRVHSATFKWANDRKLQPLHFSQSEFIDAVHEFTKNTPPPGFLFNVNE
jgi:hypothetical protein